MPGSLDHAPSVIVQELLFEMGLGKLPPLTPWPIYAYNEPTDPDSVITIRDTQGSDDGRIQVSGQIQGMQGFQVRVRSQRPEVGRKKANDIRIALSEDVNRRNVTIDSATYFVQCIARIGDVIHVGKETPTSKRDIFTINALLCVEQI